MSTFRGILFYCYLAVSLIFLAAGVLITMPFSSAIWRYNMFCRPWGRVSIYVLELLCGVHHRVIGQENMPSADQSVVVLSKHQSAWDSFWLGGYLTNPACFLYKKSLNWIPGLGWALWGMDMLSADRKKGRSSFESFMEKGPKKLAQGFWICLFPEGTRVPPGEHVKYKTGGARFACATGTPILPICHNAGHCWPKDSIAKIPGTITVSIGPLIQTVGRDPHEVTREVEEWIENELVRLEKEEC